MENSRKTDAAIREETAGGSERQIGNWTAGPNTFDPVRLARCIYVAPQELFRQAAFSGLHPDLIVVSGQQIYGWRARKLGGRVSPWIHIEYQNDTYRCRNGYKYSRIDHRDLPSEYEIAGNRLTWIVPENPIQEVSFGPGAEVLQGQVAPT